MGVSEMGVFEMGVSEMGFAMSFITFIYFIKHDKIYQCCQKWHNVQNRYLIRACQHFGPYIEAVIDANDSFIK